MLVCASAYYRNCRSTYAPNCYAQCLKTTDQRKFISKLNDNITDIILYEMKEVVFFTRHKKYGNISTSNLLNPKCSVIYQSIPYNVCKHKVIWALVCTTSLYTALHKVYYAHNHFCQWNFILHECLKSEVLELSCWCQLSMKFNN